VSAKEKIRFDEKDVVESCNVSKHISHLSWGLVPAQASVSAPRALIETNIALKPRSRFASTDLYF